MTTKPRILVVDDDEMVLNATLRCLKREFDVVGTTRPKDALELAKKDRFAAVVSDIQMPEMNGLDLCEAVCQEVPSMKGKFVFATGGVGSPQLKKRLEDVEYLRKPYPPADLVAAVRKITG